MPFPFKIWGGIELHSNVMDISLIYRLTFHLDFYMLAPHFYSSLTK